MTIRSTVTPLACLGLTLVVAGCAGSAPPVRKLDPPVLAQQVEQAASSADPPNPAHEQPEATGDAEESRAWLGVELALRQAQGVLVRATVPGSPAEVAGLTSGDVIMSIDGQVVSRPADVVSLVGSRAPGDRIAIVLLRGDKERLLAATLEPQPNDESLMKKRYVDAQAPRLDELKTVKGSVPPSLPALRGNVVLLEFWAGWCVPCRITAPLLSSWSDRYAPEGLRVLGVTNDPVVQAADAAERHGMRYAIFSDETGKTTLSYRAFALPTLFVIDRRGVVRDVMVGFSTARLKEIEGLVERLLAER